MALAAQQRRSIGFQPVSACLGLGGHGNSEIGARFSLRGALLDGEVLGTLECKHPHEWLCPGSPVFGKAVASDGHLAKQLLLSAEPCVWVYNVYIYI